MFYKANDQNLDIILSYKQYLHLIAEDATLHHKSKTAGTSPAIDTHSI